MQTASGEAGDLRRQLAPVLVRKWLILGVVLVSVVATYLLSDQATARYRAQTQLYIENNAAGALVSDAVQSSTDRTTQNVAQLVASRAVASAVTRDLRLPQSPESLLEDVTATGATGSDFVTVTAEATSGPRAAALVNGFARAYTELSDAQFRRELASAVDDVRVQLSSLQGQSGTEAQRAQLRTTLQQLLLSRSVGSSGTRQVDRAEPPAHPYSPRPKRNAVFALALSALLAVALAVTLDRFDRRLRHIDDFAGSYQYGVLATIPHTKEPTGSESGEATVDPTLREAYRSLRSSIRLQSVDRPLRRLVVTSAIPGEGKTTTVRNLALSLVEGGASVAVVEADLRKPTLAASFGLPATLESERSLVPVLIDAVTLGTALVDVAVHAEGLDVLARMATTAAPDQTGARGEGHAGPGLVLLAAGAAPANPPAVLASHRMSQVLDELGNRYDVVLIDTPPLLAVSDALPLIEGSDGVLVVGRVGLSKRDSARRLGELMQQLAGANVLGVVVNDHPIDSGTAYAGYSYPYA